MSGFLSGRVGVTVVNTGDISDEAITAAKLYAAWLASLTDATLTTSDLLLFGDATDSNNMKRDTVQGLLDLVPTPQSGALVYLGGATASNSATVELTSLIDNATYDVHKIVVSGARAASPSAGGLRIRCSANNGSSFDSSAVYNSVTIYMDDSSPSVAGANNPSTTSIAMHSGRTIDEASFTNFGMVIDMYNAGSTSIDTFFHGIGGVSSDAEDDCAIALSTGAYKTEANAVNALQFFFDSGNIQAGDFRIYGLAKA